MKKIAYWLSIIIVGIILGLTLQFTKAWTEPTSAPPNANVNGPITTGTATQLKNGALGVGSLIHGYSSAVFDGNVGIGTTNPAQKLDVNGIIRTTLGGFMFPDGTVQTTAAKGGNFNLNQSNCSWTTGTCVKASGSSSALNVSASSTCPIGTYMAGTRTTICSLSSCSSDYCISISQKVEAYCCAL
jgi:hypothetical protein